MAAATQTARTSPPNSKMSSPKDSKGALPVVTKTEGELLHCPAQTQPSCPVAGALSPLPFTFQAHVAPACVCVCSCARITSSSRTYPLGEPLLTMSIPEPAEVKTDTKDIRKYPPAQRDQPSPCRVSSSPTTTMPVANPSCSHCV